jgi:hypothetical protein
LALSFRQLETLEKPAPTPLLRLFASNAVSQVDQENFPTRLPENQPVQVKALHESAQSGFTIAEWEISDKIKRP